jgi:hypothetical protein
MAVTNIVDDHHFVKHCKNKVVIRENGNIISVHPAAFELRASSKDFRQEKTLSGVYYEFFDGDAAEKICACYHFIKMEMKAKDVLIRMNARLVREQGKNRSIPLRVTHEPDKDCLAYAAIHGMPVKADDELNGLLQSLAVLEICEISSIL